jgi:outer membrane protein assembly factor BamB
LTVVIATSADLVSSGRAESNWPRWRGPNQDGQSAETDLPITWDDSNVAWKIELPGIGQSSPVIWGERMFMTAAKEKGRERIVFCVDRNDGKLLWQHTAWTGDPEPSHVMNGWASATCVTDGEVVVAFFGRGGMHAYSLDGKPLWTKDLGPFESPWGVAACPVLYGDLVIQNGDADENAFIAAFDKKTGSEVWRTKRPDNRGWSTPILVKVDGHDELVLNGDDGVRGYNPKNGDELWFCASVKGRGEPTVTPAGDMLCVVNGLGGEFYAVHPGGKGDVTGSRVVWHTPRKGGRDCPSPIVVGKYVIVSDMAGIVTCYQTTDGVELWKERVSGKTSGSPFAAGGLVYLQNENGQTFVIRPGPKLDVVATNTLTASDQAEVFRASLVPSEGQIFSRSDRMLRCIGTRKRSTTASAHRGTNQ